MNPSRARALLVVPGLVMLVLSLLSGCVPAGAATAPAVTVAERSTSSFASAQVISRTDPRLRYLGATDFRSGTGSPDSTMYQSSSRYPHVYGSQPVWSLEFVTNAPAFEWRFAYAAGTMYRLTVNGQQQGAYTRSTGATLAGQRYVLKVAFGSRAVRTVRLDFISAPFGGLFLPKGATLTSTAKPVERVAVLGDSITSGSAQNHGYGLGTWLPATAAALGWRDTFNQAIGGTGYVAAGPARPFHARLLPDVVAYAPTRVVVFGGFNDRYTDPLLVRPAVDKLLADLRTALPRAKITVIGCWQPSVAAPDASRTDAVVRSAALAEGVPFISPVTGRSYDALGKVVADRGPWITSANRTGFVGTDGVHPTDAGHAYLSGVITAALRVTG